MATERIIVHESIAPAFSKAFAATVNQVFPPNQPAPVLVNSAATAKNHKLISDAVKKGAEIVLGDVNAKEESATRMRPIVVGGVNNKMDMYYEESFGPSVSLITVGSEEEAIEVANDTIYGLSAAVFTQSLERGMRVARRVESG